MTGEDLASNSFRIREGLKAILDRRLPAALEWYREVRAKLHGVQARLNHKRWGTYIGVTGSCGKSTTTHLVGATLKAQGTTQTFVQHNSRRPIFRRLAKITKPVDYIV